MSYSVTVFPGRSSEHLTQVYAGLYELRRAGIVDLRVKVGPAPWGGYHLDNVLCVEVAGALGTEPRTVVFDVRDGAAIDATLLAETDVYFKRTCDRTVIGALPASLRGMVRPYGLNYACTSDEHLRSMVYARQLYATERADSKSNAGCLPALRRRLRLPLRWLGVPRREDSADAPISYARFEAGADSPANCAVLFLTRLWSSNNAPSADPRTLQQMNRTRIDIVKTLRRRFGTRFVGGVQRDQYSEQQCPDCVTDVGATKSSYLTLMKSHLIAVASDGLHGSIGWKVAEYVAASRCIVSEPLRLELPGCFVEGEHYLKYHTPAECADACERILADPIFADAMRRNNEDYYQRHLKPPALMLSHLQTAVASR